MRAPRSPQTLPGCSEPSPPPGHARSSHLPAVGGKAAERNGGGGQEAATEEGSGAAAAPPRLHPSPWEAAAAARQTETAALRGRRVAKPAPPPRAAPFSTPPQSLPERLHAGAATAAAEGGGRGRSPPRFLASVQSARRVEGTRFSSRLSLSRFGQPHTLGGDRAPPSSYLPSFLPAHLSLLHPTSIHPSIPGVSLSASRRRDRSPARSTEPGRSRGPGGTARTGLRAGGRAGAACGSSLPSRRCARLSALQAVPGGARRKRCPSSYREPRDAHRARSRGCWRSSARAFLVACGVVGRWSLPCSLCCLWVFGRGFLLGLGVM